MALRDVIEAIAGAGHAPTRGRVRRRRRARAAAARAARARHRAAGVAGPRTSRRPRAAPRCSRRRARGCTRAVADAGAGDGVRARASRSSPTRSCAASTTTCTAGTGGSTTRCGRCSTASVMQTAPSIPPSRRRALEAAASGELDVLIVGGGITGAGAALDAATRGLRVGLVEARDLAAGTSSASSKLIHGGLRYLEMGDIGLVREALRERELLLTRIAPHLVEPVPFLWPLRGRGWERAYLGAGLAALRQHRRRALGAAPPPPEPPRRAGGGAGAARRTRSSARCSSTTRSRTTRGWSPSSPGRPRRTAPTSPRACGSTGFRRPRRGRGGRRGDGRAARAARPPRRRARSARGPTALRELAGGRSAWRNVHSKGIHVFVAARPHPDGDRACSPARRRACCSSIPWQGGWLIGDTDTPWSGGADQPVATRRRRRLPARQDQRAARRAAAPRRRPRRDGGLRPLVAEAARSDTTRISRQHVVESPAPGLTTIAGGKYTTYRVMAADLIDAVGRALGNPTASVTRDVPLLRSGPRRRSSRALIDERPELAEPLEGGGGHLRAEVVHACTHEGALHLEDVLERRTRLALTASDRGLARRRARGGADGRRARLGAGPHAARGRGLAAPGSPRAARPRPSATTAARSRPTARTLAERADAAVPR